MSLSLVNGAFGAIGANGDNEWHQWMLHCRQWRFCDGDIHWRQWRSPLAWRQWRSPLAPMDVAIVANGDCDRQWRHLPNRHWRHSLSPLSPLAPNDQL